MYERTDGRTNRKHNASGPICRMSGSIINKLITKLFFLASCGFGACCVDVTSIRAWVNWPQSGQSVAAFRSCFIGVRLGFITRSADTNTGPVYCRIIDAAMERMAISHVDITNKLQHGTMHETNSPPIPLVPPYNFSQSIHLSARRTRIGCIFTGWT